MDAKEVPGRVREIAEGLAKRRQAIQLSQAKAIKHGDIPKEAVLYIFRPEVNITCQKCVFIRGNQCAVLGPDEMVSPKTGSCGFYIHGDLGEAQQIPWIGFITKIQAGYAENKTGFQCKRCEYFNMADNSCRKVDKDSEGDTPGIIHPNGCCNRWEADDKRAKLGEEALDKLLANSQKA